ncbi:hypothetical protein TIFTF001_002651 [Ficus carica]|uniref:KOW domain-containing protein n=1 Tax=Ficus carica TaxID=3494 RepID=A0AA87ZVD2_FICCA|nr:hypothetical protein TIFTF001_002651 [Ficus carica]
MIIRGKEKGETGIVERVIRSQNRVLVEGKNLELGSVSRLRVVLSIVMLNCIWSWETKKPCKVGVRYLEDCTKVRVSRGLGTSGSIILRPENLKIWTKPRPTVAGPKDTPMDVVLEKTYDAKTGLGMPDL